MFNFLKRWVRTEHEICQENLSAYLDGELTSRDHLCVERHLEKCAACQADLESLSKTVALLRAAPTLQPPRSFLIPATETIRQRRVERRRLSYAYTQAAMVFATVLLVLVVSGDVLLQYQTVGPLMRAAKGLPGAMVTGVPAAESALDDRAQTWAAPAAPVELGALPTAAEVEKQAHVDASIPTPAPSDQVVGEGQAIEARAVPSETFATSAGAPPMAPAPADAGDENRLLTASPPPRLAAAETVSPTDGPTATPSPTARPSETPSPTPTPVPPQPTVQAPPLQPEEVTERWEPTAQPLPSGPLALLQASRPFLRWIEALLVTIIAALLVTMLWLRRRQRSA